MIKENSKQVAGILKVLAHDKRLLLLCLLIEESKNVGEIAEEIGPISLSSLSQHLSLLKAHGILESEKTGQNVRYKIADKRIEAVIQVLKEQYC